MDLSSNVSTSRQLPRKTSIGKHSIRVYGGPPEEEHVSTPMHQNELTELVGTRRGQGEVKREKRRKEKKRESRKKQSAEGNEEEKKRGAQKRWTERTEEKKGCCEAE
ncbi:hypothetical protein ANTRET_LOCUS6723 [Anthophora retusa]